MRNKVNILIVTVLLAALAGHAAGAGDDSTPTREYQIKAAFIYNFMKFVNRPEEATDDSEKKTADSSNTVTIGIIGKNPFGNAFEAVKNKPVKDKKIVIKRFGEYHRLIGDRAEGKAKSEANIEALRQCHLLFVCSSEKQNYKKIIESVRDHSVLTVSEIDGFVEAGGIINLILEQKKLVFEVNLVAGKRAKLEISSKLLRIAKRVIKEQPSGEAKD